MINRHDSDLVSQIRENVFNLNMPDATYLDTAIAGIRSQTDFEKFSEDMTSKLKGEEKIRAIAFLNARRSDLKHKMK